MIGLRKALLALGLLSLPLLMLTSLAPAASAAPKQAVAAKTNVSGTTGPLPVNASGLLESPVDLIGELGRGKYAATYGGLRVLSDDESQIEIYLSDLSPAEEAAFQAAAGSGVTVTFAATRKSMASQLALQQTILTAAPGLRTAGIDINSVGPDLTTGLVGIGVGNPTASAVGRLNSMFGADNVSVHQQNPVAATSSYNRASFPGPAWTGGIGLLGSNSSTCTAGFSILIGSTSYLLTAAHCLSNGSTAANAMLTSLTSTTGSGATVGTITGQDLTDHSMDIELIAAQGNGTFLSGGTPYAPNVGVWGYENSAVGRTVHNNGAYSGNVLSVIQAIDQCQYVTEPVGRYICALAHSTSSTNSVANRGGDSGGPIDHVINGYGYAVGTDSLSSGADATACVYNSFTGCYTDMYFTDMGYSLSYYGASINNQ